MKINEIKKIKKNGTVITLFDRFGGNTIGYQLAGLNVKMNINKDYECNKVYKYNNDDVVLYENEIENIKSKYIKKIIKTDVDILDIIMPQLTFYIYKNFFEMNPILINILSLIREINSKVVIIHMNPQILKNKNNIYLNTIIENIKYMGYMVHYEKLNYKYYEVPISGEIVTMICVKKYINIKPIFPEPKSYVITTKNAIGHLVNSVEDEKFHNENYYKFLEKINSGTKTKQIKKILKDELNFNFKIFRREKWNEPFYNLNSYVKEKPIHPLVNRYMTFNELLLLQTFPEDFIKLGERDIDLENICLSIPCNYIKNIAEVISKYILEF